MPPASSPFDALGLSETATPREARRAYRRLAFRYHPDRNPGDVAAAEAFLAAKEAFEQIASSADDARDADRVVAEMQRAAAEAERRRGRTGGPGRAWQQVHVPLTRPLGRRLRDALASRTALVGLGVAAAVSLGLSAGGWVPAWAAALVASAVGAVAHAVRASVDASWAVETHWRGLRDLRWGVLVGWDEVREVREGAGALDLVLTEGAARRLAPLVPADVLAEPAVYRLPLPDAARLAAVVRAHKAG